MCTVLPQTEASFSGEYTSLYSNEPIATLPLYGASIGMSDVFHLQTTALDVNQFTPNP